MTDTRPLHVRVRALANRYDAVAIGAEKKWQARVPGASAQDITNAQATAATLHEAATELEGYAAFSKRLDAVEDHMAADKETLRAVYAELSARVKPSEVN